MNLAWYWWVLIAVGVIVIGILKVTLFKKWMRKKQLEDDNE